MITEVAPPFDPAAGGPRELLYSVQMAGALGYIYLVYVTDTAQMQNMPFRMLTAFVRIWERHRAQHPGPLPLIVPTVISSVPGGWTGPRTLHELCTPHPRGVPRLSELIPDLSLRIQDLTRPGNETLQPSPLLGF